MFGTEKRVFFYMGVLHKLACSGEVTAATRGGGKVTLVPLGTLRVPRPAEHLELGVPTHRQGLWEERGEKSQAAPPRLLLLILRRNFIFLSPFPMQK